MMTRYTYDRAAAQPDPKRILTGGLPPSLGRRSGWELRVIGELSDIFPFQVSPGKGNDEVDMLAVAAGAVDTMKRKHADLWNGMMEVNMAPKAVADIMVSVMLSERRQFQAYSYDRTASAEAVDPELFRPMVVKAIKRIGDGVRAMGLGSIVKYNPQERIDTDRYGGIHSTFFLRFDHADINPGYRPGINFYWDTSKQKGSVGTSNLVQRNKGFENLPLAKMDEAMLEAADAILADLKGQLGKAEPESKEAWSVVTLGKDHGYATEVEVFSNKARAEAKARELGNCYVVKGTQMWNEPLGQVEEHNRTAPFKFFR